VTERFPTALPAADVAAEEVLHRHGFGVLPKRVSKTVVGYSVHRGFESLPLRLERWTLARRIRYALVKNGTPKIASKRMKSRTRRRSCLWER